MSQEAPPRTPTHGGSGGLQLRSEGAKGTVFVEGATTVEASSAEEVMGMLRQGAARRTVGETAANERSSRSHSIFSLRLAVDEPPSNASQLVLHRESAYHLVDLAGSERQKQVNTSTPFPLFPPLPEQLRLSCLLVENQALGR
jgi:hypothetical protein